MASGKDTGVKVEVRSGGPAIGFQSVTSQLYGDPNVLLGYVSTDEQISNSGTFPTKAVVASFNINPQIIMWDPATYPNVKTIADLKATGVKVRYFSGAAYMDFLTQSGQLDKNQVDGSYDGTPANFVADGGKSAQQGFVSAEPYFYEKVLKDWMKPIAFQLIHDAGWTSYAQDLATTPDNVTKYANCFKKLVPIIQQSQVDFVKSPDKANALVLDLVGKYNNGWLYDAGQAKASVAAQLQYKLVANSPDGTLGSFDMDRVAKFVTTAVPIYQASQSKPKAGLTANDLVTNEFIDRASTSRSRTRRRSGAGEWISTRSRHVCSRFEIVERGELGRVVADAAHARREDHRRRTHARQHLGVVTGARRHAAHRMTESYRRALDEIDDRGIELDGREAGHTLGGDRDAFRVLEFVAVLRQCPLGVLQQGFVGVAQIDGERRLPAHHVHEVGKDVDLADGAHLMTTHVAGEAAHEHRDRRGGRSASWRMAIGVVPA
jgi:hypothetical protein